MKRIGTILFLVGCLSGLPVRAIGPDVCVETSEVVAKIVFGTIALVHSAYASRHDTPDPLVTPLSTFLMGTGFFSCALYDIATCWLPRK